MSLSQRLLRIARQTLSDFTDALREPAPHADARAELESFLSGPRPATRSASPPPPPPDPLQPYYDALGAPVGANRATVEKIWRQRVLETHPDRFMHDPAEQQRASERLRRYNEAHDVLDRELTRREAG